MTVNVQKYLQFLIADVLGRPLQRSVTSFLQVRLSLGKKGLVKVSYLKSKCFRPDNTLPSDDLLPQVSKFVWRTVRQGKILPVIPRQSLIRLRTV